MESVTDFVEITSMQNLRKQLANELVNDCKTVTDVRNAINSLFKDALEAILEAEITEHLGYEKHSSKGDHSGNSRNGSTPKTVQSRAGKTSDDIDKLFLMEEAGERLLYNSDDE